MHTRLYALLIVFAIGGCDSTTTRTIRVFENRERNSGREIALHVVVLHAREHPVAADPIVVFTGGPGLSTTEDTRYWARVTARLRPHHDVILVDQRGTGGSGPLPCNLFETGDCGARQSLSSWLPASRAPTPPAWPPRARLACLSPAGTRL
jgi:pimeloyl-ACP methyl ester carboxylesterase